MKPYKAIVFDIDGTLLDTAKMNVIPLIKVIKKELNKIYTYDELTYLLAFSGTVTLDKIGIPKDQNDRVLHEWIDEIQQSGIVSTPYDGVISLLNNLKSQNVLMGIVSSKEKRQYEFDMVKNHMDHYFHEIVLAEDTKLHKPHPDPLLLCLEKLKVDAKDALYIGDSDADGFCAHACGCDFAFASWGPLELTAPYTYHLEKPMDLMDIIEGGKG